MKKIIGALTVFAVTLSVFCLALFLASKLPNDALHENYEHSVYYYANRDAYEDTNGGRLGAIADHYADAIWLNVAWHMGRGSSLITHYYNGEELGENAGLYRSVMEDAAPNTDYTRYWHGTAIFIRLLHTVTDVQGIKTIGFTVFLLLAALTLFLLGRRHLDLAVILAASLCAVRIWNIRLSMEYQPAFLIAFALLPLCLISERKSDRWLEFFSIIGGVAVAFFDFLTTETVTVLLPLAVVFAVRAKEGRLRTLRHELKLIVSCGLLWLLSYGGTFLVKWLAVSLLTDQSALQLALQSANVRMLGGETAVTDPYNSPAHLFSCILANLTVLFGGTARVQLGRVIIGLASSGAVLFSVWYLFRKKQPHSCITPILTLLGGMVLVRFFVLNNHSYVHEFFVYRALVSSVFALLTVVWLQIRRRS